MDRVAIIGAGEIGGAIAHVIRANADVVLWDNDPKRAPENMKPLEETVRGASVVFLCIPSRAIREVAEQIEPLVTEKTIIVSLAKGLEAETAKTLDAVLKESFPQGQPVSLFGGPLLAEEILVSEPGMAVLAADDHATFDAVHKLFAGTCVHVEYEQSMRSVALSSVCKNIYAIGMGVAEGLDWGWNGKGWLASVAIREMTETIRILGGTPSVVAGSAGVGDFLATGMSADSKNRTTGFAFARTGECTNPGEGCRAVTQIMGLLGKDAERFPLMNAIDRVVNKNEPARDVFEKLRAR